MHAHQLICLTELCRSLCKSLYTELICSNFKNVSAAVLHFRDINDVFTVIHSTYRYLL